MPALRVAAAPARQAPAQAQRPVRAVQNAPTASSRNRLSA